jgi:hypothetical protein
MAGPIKVSASEFERLEQLKAMEKTGQKKTGADVAGDALQFGKKLVIGYIIAGAVLLLIGAAVVLPWMARGFSQVDRSNQQLQAGFAQAQQESSSRLPLALNPDGSSRH